VRDTLVQVDRRRGRSVIMERTQDLLVPSASRVVLDLVVVEHGCEIIGHTNQPFSPQREQNRKFDAPQGRQS